MIRDEIDDLVTFLNTLVALDPQAIGELVQYRVLCNQQLADHPTVQVGGHPNLDVRPGEFRVGLLGVLNGYLGTIEGGERDGWGALAAVFDDPTHELLRFERIDKKPEVKD